MVSDVQDTVQRGHLLVRKVGLDGVLVQTIGTLLLVLHDRTDFSEEYLVVFFTLAWTVNVDLNVDIAVLKRISLNFAEIKLLGVLSVKFDVHPKDGFYGLKPLFRLFLWLNL
jgi:hypothetical protein